jgi:hypothetical protein
VGVCVYVCVCMYVYVYVCMYVCIFTFTTGPLIVCMRAQEHEYIHACIIIHIYIHTYTYIQVWMFSAVDLCEIARNSVLQSGFEDTVKVCVCVCVYVSAHVCTYGHIRDRKDLCAWKMYCPRCICVVHVQMCICVLDLYGMCVCVFMRECG